MPSADRPDTLTAAGASRRPGSQWVVIVLGALTVVAGLVQLVLTQAALAAMGIPPARDAVFLFRLASLLVLLFGAALLHGAVPAVPHRPMLLWPGLQKLAGAGFLLSGYASGLLSRSSVMVAAYDGLAGLFVLWFWRRSGRLSQRLP